MDFLNQLNSVNVQVPIGYVLAVIAVIGGTIFAVRKVLLLVSALLARVTFAAVGSSALLLSGLSGAGWSVGQMNSGPAEKTDPYLLTNSELKSLANSGADKAKIDAVLDYAKSRDKIILQNRENNKFVSILDNPGTKERCKKKGEQMLPLFLHPYWCRHQILF